MVYLLTGVLALISCLLWLAIRKSHTFEFHLPESRTLTSLCATCFFGLYTLSVLSVYLRPELYVRPLSYFILTALMAGTIACEIFTSGRRHAPSYPHPGSAAGSKHRLVAAPDLPESPRGGSLVSLCPHEQDHR